MVTRSPRFSSSAPIDADARPLPSDDTTPPVTKMNLVCLPGGRPAMRLLVGPPTGGGGNPANVQCSRRKATVSTVVDERKEKTGPNPAKTGKPRRQGVW